MVTHSGSRVIDHTGRGSFPMTHYLLRWFNERDSWADELISIWVRQPREQSLVTRKSKFICTQSTKTYKRLGSPGRKQRWQLLADTDGVGVLPNVSSWMRDESRSRSRSYHQFMLTIDFYLFLEKVLTIVLIFYLMETWTQPVPDEIESGRRDVSTL